MPSELPVSGSRARVVLGVGTVGVPGVVPGVVTGVVAGVVAGVVTIVVIETTSDEPSGATPVATIVWSPWKPAGIVSKAVAVPVESATVFARVRGDE
jgi:hypothetical protein